MPKNVRDRILIVEHDPVISDLISRQALQAAGYQTFVVAETAAAISRAIQYAPDVIIVDLSLPGLSAKDLMVALTAQNIETPVVVLSQKGTEANIIQAFRLGATDYLLWPVREAEVITVVERVLKQVRERRERESLARQLQQTNAELQSRVRELTTIFSIGKAVTSITDQTLLFDRIMDGAVKVSQADMGWFLLRKEQNKDFSLAASLNLPPSLAGMINQAWDDGISSLVAMSGEPLTIHGDPLKRFKIASLGGAALIVPIKSQKEVIGLLIVMRKQPTAFTSGEQRLLEAVADYASISLVNARLFRTLEARAQQLQGIVDQSQMGERAANDILQKVKRELRDPLDVALITLNRLSKDPTARWNSDQRQSLTTFQEQLEYLNRVVDAILPFSGTTNMGKAENRCALNEILQKSVNQFQHFAQQNKVSLILELPSDPLLINSDTGQITQVIDGLLSNAIKYCNPGGRVTVQVEQTSNQLVHVIVKDTGVGIDPKQAAKIFDARPVAEQSRPRRFAGLGIGLGVMRDIVTRHNGKIWVESQPEFGTSFHFMLPLVK